MNRQRYSGVLALSILLMGGPFPGQAKATILGDFDQDCDVDSADFGHFKTCALGPGIFQNSPACADARLDADQDVDFDDFGMFQRCYSGEGIPADPICERPCSEGICCPCGQTNCSGTCTFTGSDNANCGACGNTCAAGFTCQNGSCAPCPGAACGCADLNWDGLNCGACGHACQPLEYCSWGECYGTCIGCE
jgi:hypothetical protein